jgi:hypothetical protein
VGLGNQPTRATATVEMKNFKIFRKTTIFSASDKAKEDELNVEEQ